MFSDLRTNIAVGEHGHADLHNEERARLNHLAMADNEIFYVDRYDSVQAAVTAAVNAYGGIVQFGRGDYDINELITDRASAVTLRGMGVSIHGSATILNVAEGAEGIIIQNQVGGVQAVHVRDLEVRGGAVGIHVAPSVTQTLNMHWQSLIVRLQTQHGIWIENGVYDSSFVNIQTKACAEGWLISGGGKGHNANTWMQCGAQDCIGYGVHSIGPGGQGGNSSWIGGIIQANGSAGWYMDRPLSWLVASTHFEGNGSSDGAADVIVDAHDSLTWDLNFVNVVAAAASFAQKENPPALWLDVLGSLSRSNVLGMSNAGSKSIRENGILVKDASRNREANFVWGETNYVRGGPVLYDDNGARWRLGASTEGQLTLTQI